jgi:hypothetical protein
MTHVSNRYFGPAVSLGRSTARWAIATVLLGAGALSCSTPADPTGAGGQGTGGAGGTSGGTAGVGGTAVTGGTGGTAVTGGTGGTATTGGNGGTAVTGGTGGAATTGGNGGADVTGGIGGAAVTGGAGAGGAAGSGAGAGGAAGTGAGAGGTAGGGAGGKGGTGGSGGDAGWTDLFNGRDLTGWTPSPGAAALYAVSQIDGGPAIHVYPTQADQSEQPQALLRTTQSFSSYVFHVEYKWGTARFDGRKQNARDNGICFHICNDVTKVWPESLEFQIGSTQWSGPGGTSSDNIDWVVGNVFMLVDKTRAQWSYKTVSGMQVYSPTGTKKLLGAPTQYAKGMTDKQRDKPTDWNILELTVHGSMDATYVVNGEVANGLTDMECNVGGTWGPLDRGPIGLQAEYAEVYFRNVRIQVLP